MHTTDASKGYRHDCITLQIIEDSGNRCVSKLLVGAWDKCLIRTGGIWYHGLW